MTSFKNETTKLLSLIDNSHKISQLCLISLGGSHAYGLANEQSDVDLRGFGLPYPRDILLADDFEQIQTNNEIDACVYSLSKTLKLLSMANPNIIELLGLDEESILLSSSIYETIREHSDWFLSTRVAHTFGGYATAQLRRLQNAMARDTNAQQYAQGAIRSMQASLDALPERYASLNGHATFSLNLSDEENPQVLISMHVENAAASELASFARELDSARKSAETIGKNRRKDSSKLAKHASHLIRLLHMGSEILETGEIHTKRTHDNQLLRDIKSGLWLTEDACGVRAYDNAFWDLLNESQTRFEYAEQHTSLPSKPNLNEINDFLSDTYRNHILNN